MCEYPCMACIKDRQVHGYGVIYLLMITTRLFGRSGMYIFLSFTVMSAGAIRALSRPMVRGVTFPVSRRFSYSVLSVRARTKDLGCPLRSKSSG